MNKLACFLMLFFLSLAAFAQQDSLVVINAKWEVKQVAPGVRLKRCLFNDSILFKSNQSISILDVKKKRRMKFDLGVEPKLKKTTSDFGKRDKAIAAINGTFFDVANGGSVDYIRLNGSVINENRIGASGTRAVHQKSAVVINNGALSLMQWDGSSNWEKNIKGEDVMVSGPMLLADSKEVISDTSSFSLSRHPRSIIALDGNKHILFITIDGRNANASGMSLYEVAKVLRWMKCREAVNLDGGGSTTLWVKNEPGYGVVNYPSDNKKWDHEGERKVANVVLLKKK